jgi:hypothetical protein
MKFPIIEIVDRYAIAVVKHTNTNGANTEELAFYLEQMRNINLNTGQSLVKELIAHHAYVWSLEDDFKKGRVDSKPLEEIGRLAIAIRNQGYERTRIKNALAEMFDDPIKDVKQYGKSNL